MLSSVLATGPLPAVSDSCVLVVALKNNILRRLVTWRKKNDTKQPQLPVLFDFKALRTNTMNKLFSDFSLILARHPLFIGRQQSVLIPRVWTLELTVWTRSLSWNVATAVLFTLAYHLCIYGCREKTAANHRLTTETCNELSYQKTRLCPSAVKANYVRLFSDREHVNTSRRGSSHSPWAAFLFMSFNSINGLLSHWTVLAPDFFFLCLSLSLPEWSICSCFSRNATTKEKNSLVASAPVTFAKLGKGFCWRNSCSGGCVRLSGEFKAMLTLSVQSREDNWGSAEGIETTVASQRSVHSCGCDLFDSQSANGLWCFQSRYL